MGVGRTARIVMRVGALGMSASGGIGAASAQETAGGTASYWMRPVFTGMHTHNAAGLAVLIGLTVFATILSLLHLRERARWARRERDLIAELSALRGAHDRAELMLNADRQVVIAWAGRGEAVVLGETGVAAIRGGSASDVLAFGSWLLPQDAAALDAEVKALRRRGTGFRSTLRGLAGQHIEAQGQAVGGRAMLRLRETTRERRELAQAHDVLDEARRRLATLASLLDAIPQPVWHRAQDGRLAFVNAAYAAAVEGGGRDATLSAQTELLDRSDRERVARDGNPARPLRLSGVVAGERRILDVTEGPIEGGRAGIAIDVSDLDSAHESLHKLMDAHERTLDQLPTAVAMFDASQRLIFHNAPYQKLWDLDAAFLASKPRDSEILDRLRNERKLPEEADFRFWKAGVLAAYQSVETSDTTWYLPDRRTLRVRAEPNPQGGLTYLFEDLSENLKLARDFSRLTKVQAETLDALKEPVAVFGADGRLTFANKAFQTIWRIDEARIQEQPRIDAVIAGCLLLSPDPQPWTGIRSFVTGLADTRNGLACRLEMLNGEVLDCTAQALPEGATLLTLIDVTASVNVERALVRENDALERAAQLRDTFVHHVSYELRSPLTNIIGFTQLLDDGTVGALNPRQREYSEHIMRSSTALLAIINDILDLASIDARSLELQHEAVDVRETIDAAARGIEDRLAESQIALERDVPADIGSFVADGKRVRQILFNLFSNAIGFSEKGQRVRVEARRAEGGDVVLRVIDHGRGIPPEVQARVFDRFESHTLGTRHRGVGLGLSIVRSFVELHGGRVTIASAPGTGTSVTCTFPIKPTGNREAAE